MKIGQELAYPWPHIDGFYNTKATEKIIKSLEKNEFYHISEKFDGSNICLSSQGWVSGRKNVFAVEEILETTNFQGVKCERLIQVLSNLKKWKNSDFETQKIDEILLYGEFILNGTSNSKFDRFKYKKDGFYPGDFLIFAIGFVFNDDDDDNDLKENLKEKIKSDFNNLLECKQLDESKTFYVSLVNFENRELFTKQQFQTVRCFQGNLLSNLLVEEKYFIFGENSAEVSSRYFIDGIENREVEGWVLHNRDASDIIKWKFVTEKNAYIDEHMQKLQDNFIGDYDDQVQHMMLQYLCNHYDNCDHYINVLEKIFFTSFYDRNIKKLKKGMEFYIDQFKTDLKHLDSNVEFMVHNETIAFYREFKTELLNFNPGKKFLDNAVKLEIKKLIFVRLKQLAVDVLYTFNLYLKK